MTLVGPEGVFGAFEACGSRKSFARLDVEIGGAVLRIPAGYYREVFDGCAALRTSIHKYMEITVVEARQFVACNALHSVEARLARALLDACERADDRTLSPTQGALAHLLGVQRTTVAAAISTLQRTGCLKSGRGVIELMDPARLETAACSCRATIAFARREIDATTTDACEA